MTELTDLVGLHMLDAVDFENVQRERWAGGPMEDSSVCRFRLDGVVYTAIEDPSDGYRSSMRELAATTDAMVNVFPPIQVLGRHRTAGAYNQVDDVLELVDVVTGLVVLEVGTDNTDDYYPGFVSNWRPENMVTNAPLLP